MSRNDFIDFLLEKGECWRFCEDEIDAIKQFCFWLHENTELDKSMERITELEKALVWSRDMNTGFEPSVSVMQRYYDELLGVK